MKVICHLVANINDFLPLPSDAHLQHKFGNKSSYQMSYPMNYGMTLGGGIAGSGMTAGSKFRETIQEIYTIYTRRQNLNK